MWITLWTTLCISDTKVKKAVFSRCLGTLLNGAEKYERIGNKKIVDYCGGGAEDVYRD